MAGARCCPPDALWRRVSHEVAGAALGDGAGQGGVTLHHAAVLRRAVVGVLQLAVGLMQERLELLVVLVGSLANKAAAQAIVTGHGGLGVLAIGAAGPPARNLPRARGDGQPCQRERTGLAKLFTKPSAPNTHPGPHTDGTAEPAVSDPSRSGPTANTNQEACPRCGGSGQLRTGHGAYRTCLDCAGRGSIANDQVAMLQGRLPARAAVRA
jgi:hypothetical protein